MSFTLGSTTHDQKSDADNKIEEDMTDFTVEEGKPFVPEPADERPVGDPNRRELDISEDTTTGADDTTTVSFAEAPPQPPQQPPVELAAPRENGNGSGSAAPASLASPVAAVPAVPAAPAVEQQPQPQPESPKQQPPPPPAATRKPLNLDLKSSLMNISAPAASASPVSEPPPPIPMSPLIASNLPVIAEDVVERYVLSEIGAVRELDAALDKTRGILETALYECARHSLFHVAKSREDLQRSQREFEIERLRQEFESKRLDQREADLKKREDQIRKREDVMLKREQQLLARDRALERIQVFANEDLRRQRLTSLANVELSHLTLEHLRRLELCVAETPQQFFLGQVSKYLSEHGANVGSGGAGAGAGAAENDRRSPSPSSSSSSVKRHASSPKLEDYEEEDTKKYQPSAEELVVSAFHPLPPSSPAQQDGSGAMVRFGGGSRSRQQLQQQQQPSPFFSQIEASPSFFFKMQRDHRLDVCPLHVRGSRAMHVARELPISKFPVPALRSSKQQHETTTQAQRHFAFNVISGSASATAAAPPMTHSTLGEGIFDIELFPPKVVRSFLLLSGDAADTNPLELTLRNTAAAAAATSPEKKLTRAQKEQLAAQAHAFKSNTITFSYFAQREGGGGGGAAPAVVKNDAALRDPVVPSDDDVHVSGQAPPPTVLNPNDYTGTAFFEDSVVLVVGSVAEVGAAAISGTQQQQQQQQRRSNSRPPSSSPDASMTSRPSSAMNVRFGGGGAQQQQQSAKRTLTVQNIVARMPLAQFREQFDDAEGDAADAEEELRLRQRQQQQQQQQGATNFAVHVDLAARNLCVSRVEPATDGSGLPCRLRPGATSKIAHALVASGQADQHSPGRLHEPLSSAVICFGEELAAPKIKTPLVAMDGALFLGVMLTSPCGAVEFVRLETPTGAQLFPPPSPWSSNSNQQLPPRSSSVMSMTMAGATGRPQSRQSVPREAGGGGGGGASTPLAMLRPESPGPSLPMPGLAE